MTAARVRPRSRGAAADGVGRTTRPLQRLGRSRAVLGLGVISALAACGSTVQVGGRGPSTSAQGADGLAAASSGTAGATGNSSGSGTGAAGAAGGGALPGSGGYVAGGGAAGPASADGQPGVPAPAVHTTRSATVVRLGIVYLKGLNAAYQAAGSKSATTDSQADYTAVINDLNSRGGIAGRRVVASFYAIDSSSSTPPATQLEAACTHFTQDEKVDAVLSYTPGSGDVLANCLRDRGTPLVVGSNEADVSAATLVADPLLWEPAEVSLDRLERALPRFLASQHWADTRWGTVAGCAADGPRIGVVTFDQPDWRYAYDHELAPAFQATGRPVYDAAFVNVSGSTANQLADASSAVQSAILKFSSECIDHVAFASNVAVDYLFMNVAELQGYHPRYGLSSLEAPPVIIQNLADPASELHGAIGVGWSPFSDVAIQDFDTTARAPAQGCMQVLQRAGLAPTDNNSAILAVPSCEGPYFAAAAFGAWFASPPGTSLLDAVDGLAASYRPTGAFSAAFSATEHDGSSSYRPLSFVDSCTCFRYTGGLQPW